MNNWQYAVTGVSGFTVSVYSLDGRESARQYGWD